MVGRYARRREVRSFNVTYSEPFRRARKEIKNPSHPFILSLSPPFNQGPHCQIVTLSSHNEQSTQSSSDVYRRENLCVSNRNILMSCSIWEKGIKGNSFLFDQCCPLKKSKVKDFLVALFRGLKRQTQRQIKKVQMQGRTNLQCMHLGTHICT